MLWNPVGKWWVGFINQKQSILFWEDRPQLFLPPTYQSSHLSQGRKYVCCMNRRLVPRALFWPGPFFFSPCGFKIFVTLCLPRFFQFQASILFAEIHFSRSFWSCEKFWGFLSITQKLYHRPLSMLWLMLRCCRNNTLKLPRHLRHLLIWVKIYNVTL